MEGGERDRLSTVFAALADPTRREILARLAGGDANVGELAAPFRMSQPAVSKHLKVLEQAGLISRTRQATARLSHLEAEPLREATAWLARYRDYWEEAYGRLDQLLVSLQGPQGTAQDGAGTSGSGRSSRDGSHGRIKGKDDADGS
jgi:DNA-binding transcriptional ArsR family regulator